MTARYSPETRRDRLTNQWVTFAPSRSGRPRRTTSTPETETPADAAAPPGKDSVKDPAEGPVEGCPFCPGHEDMLPSIRWAWTDAEAPPPSWRTRVVPNKYPALAPDCPPPSSSAGACGLYQSRASRGTQEVIIETPHHHQPLATMPVAQVDAVLRTYLQRYRAVREDRSGLFPFLFRNHGASAGASIAHPHSQLIAPDVPPPLIQQEEQAAKARYDELGRCPYCAMVEAELTAETRLVHTDDHFVAFVPFAAEVPYELWIVPREHTPEFGRLTPPRRRALAETLRSVLERLRTRVDNPDYNLFVRTALDYDPDSPHLHWSLRIRPRTTVLAGYEQATGERINPSIPERDAAVLRDDA